MGYWKKHPKKELEAVLEEFAAAGWTIKDPPKYYRLTCPCGQHMRWLHLTPSNPNYGNQALKWMHHHTCHGSEKEGEDR